jgi:hypothetical protein
MDTYRRNLARLKAAQAEFKRACGPGAKEFEKCTAAREKRRSAVAAARTDGVGVAQIAEFLEVSVGEVTEIAARRA